LGLPSRATMSDVIRRYPEIREDVLAASERAGVRLNPSALGAPIGQPTKIWAAARNYPKSGEAEPAGADSDVKRHEHLAEAFLKPPSAISGPNDPIRLPREVGNVMPELELAIVIGRTGRDIQPSDTYSYVFGYTILLDLTAKVFGSGSSLATTRTIRKAFDTFAPTGPWIVTADEIPDPQELELRLQWNGQTQFTASTKSMLSTVSELVAYFSSISTLLPGDIIATGNPTPGLGPTLGSGDELRASIGGIGELTVRVA